MDISEILSTKFTEFDIGTPLSKVAGAFENQELDAVVVTDGDEYRGIVSRRQLASSSNQPSAKVGSQVQHVPTVKRTEDVREVARLMIGSDTKTLPVLDGDHPVGVVTADAVLEAVRPFLDAVTVDDAYSSKLVSATPDTTIGKALNMLRESGIAHLPVIDGDELVGVVSLYDVIEFTTRGGSKSQGGSPGSFGGRGRSEGSHGGFGAREGDSDRMLDLPVRNLMSDTVVTVKRSATLDEIVETMFEHEISSLVVTADETDDPVGIITKTDVIEALTWERQDRNAVQVFGLDLLEGMDYDDVSALIENMTSKYGEMTVIKASIELQEHKEQNRGVPLVLARIRLVTDRGYFTADGEGYGASHALRLAANAVERQLLKGKTYGQSKKRTDADAQEHLYGWWLVG
ncbi:MULTISPECIES: CBS domain-containing protein [unclassified Haloferax]|uniref:CBS domain-containing protein n=1 Tax=Haloferax sp. Atlit-48N TaxID=2077198 RepID=A0ACD5I1Q9_9EURY|nr:MULTISPECIES: CBS domain-containing protein [unclassified Haloferax]RDZ30284.1 signal transduction protein [Haloferax sp. Atlit-48N]RDZ33924.1 signal transduction protein [Haloferax sp. Atlit-24N]RDZ35612.1 signal transduction protein [Haloferax sp. Atlit-47N]RLM33529.1 CBS domain-containing protein [Haloferax sp. Atlit-109R]RLM40893.1 CBS domain-containing protein [Haloferax sp. Atlit-105R]